jgi:hypothetical protein
MVGQVPAQSSRHTAITGANVPKNKLVERASLRRYDSLQGFRMAFGNLL